MNKTILILLIILLPLVLAVEPGQDYTITTVPICFDDIEIKVRYTHELNDTNTYNLLGGFSSPMYSEKSLFSDILFLPRFFIRLFLLVPSL